jgi:hypothetical protein
MTKIVCAGLLTACLMLPEDALSIAPTQAPALAQAANKPCRVDGCLSEKCLGNLSTCGTSASCKIGKCIAPLGKPLGDTLTCGVPPVEDARATQCCCAPGPHR